MDAKMLEALQAATESGEMVLVCYNGGSRPGEAREMLLLQIDEQYVGARVMGEKRKRYRLDRIGWVEFQDGRRFVNADAAPAGHGSAPKATPPLNDATEAQRQRLEDAISKGQTLYIEMDDALDEEMKEVQWRGFIAPVGFVNHARGLRVICDLEPEGEYMVISECQGEGRRHLLIGSFTILSEFTRKVRRNEGGGLIISLEDVLLEIGKKADC